MKTILKRFEVWLLIVLAAGAGAFVLTTGGPPDGDEESPADSASASGETADSSFTVDKASLKRDYGSAILELHITCRNESDATLELTSPAARLLSGPDPDAPAGAEEVNAFFLAFAPPPSIPAGETGTTVLKYWVEKVHLESALWLRILEETRLVKSAAPLDLESIANQETAVFNGTEWETVEPQ